jgi:hypothetical protein
MFLLRVSEASKKRSQWRRLSDSSEGSQPIDAPIAAQTGSRGLSVSAFLATNVSDQLLSLHWQVLATCQGEVPVVKRELLSQFRNFASPSFTSWTSLEGDSSQTGLGEWPCWPGNSRSADDAFANQ